MTANADVTRERDTRVDWTSNEQAATSLMFVLWIEGWEEVTEKNLNCKILRHFNPGVYYTWRLAPDARIQLIPTW